MILFILKSLSIILILSTLIPVLRFDYWWIRVFDYPRLQKLILLLLLLLFWILVRSDVPTFQFFFFISVLLGCVIYLFSKVIPFSPLGKKMISSLTFEEDSCIHILVGNVYQPNDKFAKVKALVLDQKPDLVFLVETDKRWEENLQAIEKAFKYNVKVPLENTYGMLLYSNFEIVSHSVNYLISKEIPSIELKVKLPNGKVIDIYGIHPTPPVPSENPKSTDRDAEILLVGQKVKEKAEPAIVIGDLNDVAWSHTTELFLKISKMADPRRGRGTYNTFHAKIPFLRWPLDHIFLSKDFGLVEMKRLKSIGSDHFPISLIARLAKQETTEKLKANFKEKKEAQDKINRGLQDN